MPDDMLVDYLDTACGRIMQPMYGLHGGADRSRPEKVTAPHSLHHQEHRQCSALGCQLICSYIPLLIPAPTDSIA